MPRASRIRSSATTPLTRRTDFEGNPYDAPASALGLPTADTTFGDLTPFNGAFDLGQVVGVGDGGSLILHMSQPISTSGVTLGVHAAIGLVDTDYPNGVASSPATPYTDPRDAIVSVSEDGSIWKSLGRIEFDNPTNYYSQGITTPGFQSDPGTAVANFFQPFTGTLDDFSGKDWTDILTLLNGSAGGQWLDLSGTGLPEVNYVQFDVGSGDEMFVDSVVGISVPEPAMISGCAVLVLAMRTRGRRVNK